MASRISSIRRSAVCMALTVLCTAALHAEVTEIKVTTDTSIDCSCVSTIARDLYANKKSDEEKAIATWYFVRRACFHWPKIPTYDPVDLFNSYGFALCGHQSSLFAQICAAGGLKARTVYAPSHVLAEAYYDGAWHLFDCQVGWFAYKRDKSAVASAEEMKADPGIITDAVKEERASQPFFQCSDDPKGGPGWLAAHRPGDSPGPSKNRLMLNLRRGESITRCWGNEGKAWAPAGEKTFVEPKHGCLKQAVDANDPVNWPFWKPYAEVRSSEGAKIQYGVKRSYGNGRLVYAPDLKSEAFQDGLAKGGLLNVVRRAAPSSAPLIHPVEPGKPATLTFVIDSPYIIVDAWVDAEFRRGEKDEARVLVSSDLKDWRTVWEAKEAGAVIAQQASLKPAAYGLHRYFVRLEFKAAEDVSTAGLNALKFTTVFINNPQALPHLVPGKNLIRVAAAKLTEAGVHLRWVWDEEGKERIQEAKIDAVPFELPVDVKGTELPRMKSLTLSVDP